MIPHAPLVSESEGIICKTKKWEILTARILIGLGALAIYALAYYVYNKPDDQTPTFIKYVLWIIPTVMLIGVLKKQKATHFFSANHDAIYFPDESLNNWLKIKWVNIIDFKIDHVGKNNTEGLVFVVKISDDEKKTFFKRTYLANNFLNPGSNEQEEFSFACATGASIDRQKVYARLEQLKAQANI